MIISYLGRRGGGALYTLHLLKAFSGKTSKQLGLFNSECEVFNAFIKVCPNYERIHIPSRLLSVLNPSFIKNFILQCYRVLRPHSEEWLLITMASPFDIFLLIIVKVCHIRLAFVIHDVSYRPGISRLGLWLTRVLASQAEKVIVLSKSVRSECMELYPSWGGKLFLSAHASFNYSKKSSPYIASLPLRLVFFGRICPYKGIEHILLATSMLQNKGYDVTLEIWGEGDFLFFNSFAEKIKQLKVCNRWIKEDEIPEIFSEPGIFLATYTQASQSGVIPLALGMGMPVITTSVGALSEQVIDNFNGIILPGNLDVEIIVKKISELILDINKLQSLYDGAFQTSKDIGNWSKIANDILCELQ